MNAARYHYAVLTPLDQDYGGDEWHDLTAHNPLASGELVPLQGGPWVIDRLEPHDDDDLDATVVCRRPKWPLYLLALDRFDSMLEIGVERERPLSVDDTFIARGIEWRVVEVQPVSEPYAARIVCERDVGITAGQSAGQ